MQSSHVLEDLALADDFSFVALVKETLNSALDTRRSKEFFEHDTIVPFWESGEGEQVWAKCSQSWEAPDL